MEDKIQFENIKDIAAEIEGEIRACFVSSASLKEVMIESVPSRFAGLLKFQHPSTADIFQLRIEALTHNLYQYTLSPNHDFHFGIYIDLTSNRQVPGEQDVSDEIEQQRTRYFIGVIPRYKVNVYSCEFCSWLEDGRRCPCPEKNNNEVRQEIREHGNNPEYAGLYITRQKFIKKAALYASENFVRWLEIKFES